ncbi:hypothetical protein M9194_00580 [Vibrio sp. S4M6]|uniref:hypothetical protein n=1 Tax=Vibrio sinus TaxID=2946865 RepID=UPI002029DD4F|nr:hypothetical protein [Vibrio sinus]MCL9779926.1 hypothetical protein [Vibrio sinus]
MKSVSIAMLSMLLAGGAWAQSSAPHTWHHISLTDQASADQSVWLGRLTITSASEPAYFTDKDGKNEGQTYDFKLDNDTNPLVYGFGFNQGADFNVSYTVTLYQTSDITNQLGKSFFASKTCQFNVSAKGPANPDIRVEEYNGAKCSYNIVPGKGEDFTVG